jgi:hypothetical protein
MASRILTIAYRKQTISDRFMRDKAFVAIQRRVAAMPGAWIVSHIQYSQVGSIFVALAEIDVLPPAQAPEVAQPMDGEAVIA